MTIIRYKENDGEDYIITKELPNYGSNDQNKILRVAQNYTLEWSNETEQDGFKANTGNGTTNTTDNYEGFIFDTNEKTGIFNYGPTNETLGLRINANPILEMTNTNIRPYQKILLNNDPLLNTPNLCFADDTTYITGTNTTNKQISINTDSQEIIRFSNNSSSRIYCKYPIKIESQPYTTWQPHIFSGNWNSSSICGISFDPTFKRVDITNGNLTNTARFQNDKIFFYQSVTFSQPQILDFQTVSGQSVTVPAIGTGKTTYYLKRNPTATTELIFPNPISENLFYTIYVDNDGQSTGTCQLLTLSNDVILILGNSGTTTGTRSVLTGPVTYTLVGNSKYEMFFNASENKWVLFRIA